MRNGNSTDEAQKIWKAFQPLVDAEIRKQTKSCVRAKKMSVTVAPNGQTVGVCEPYGLTIQIPYSSMLSNLQVGDTVWVYWYFGSASTMIAMTTGEGQPIIPDEPTSSEE